MMIFEKYLKLVQNTCACISNQLWDKDNLTWHDRASGTRTNYYPKSED